MFTQNDYAILEAIVDRNDADKGIIKTKGTTKKEIMSKTNLSITKVTNTLLHFENKGLISQALKVRNSKSYTLTEEGVAELFKMKGKKIDEQ